MSDHDSRVHETHSVRGYIFVFIALLAGTVLTVWASFIHFGSQEINIAVALTIATVKAFLVVAYFMHLISERKMIYLVLGFTAFFFAGLMGLTIWSLSPDSMVHIQHVP
ncbi:MAG: cytochrome C oxidase subunit IV family protein [Limisphaerales bacterium]